MKTNLFNIKNISTLADNLNSLGIYIRTIRTKKNISVEQLAEASFLKPETIRRLESGRMLPVSNDKFRQIETALGIKPNVLVQRAEEHRKYIAQYIELYRNQIMSFVDALRIYQIDQIDRILNDTVHKFTNLARKEGDTTMATTRKMTPAKPAVKAAPKRATAKTAPTKRASTSSRSKSSR